MIKQNLKRREGEISEIAADFWLKYNPHRKAENMTGVMVADEALSKQRRSTNALATVSKKGDVKRKTRAGRKLNAVQAKYAKVMADIEAMLDIGMVVTLSDFDGYDKAVSASIIHKLRRAGRDVLTLTRNNVAVGWVLASSVFNTEIENEENDDVKG